MKKMSLNFLNRFERMIFKNKTERYPAVSSSIAMSCLIAATASILIIFGLQMANADKSLGEITFCVMFGIALLYAGYVVYKSLKLITSITEKIWLSIYSIILFSICSIAFIYLVMWVLIITLALFIFWVILKVASPSSGGKKIRVHYNDGTTEDMEETGKGILGETYYSGDKGGSRVEP